MSTDAAAVALLDQLHATAVTQLDDFIGGIGQALTECRCGHAPDSAEHASEVATGLVQLNTKDELASMLSVAILRAIVAKGGAS